MTSGLDGWLLAAIEGLPPDPDRELVMYMDPHVYAAIRLADQIPAYLPLPAPVPQWGRAEAIVEYQFPRGGWVLCHADGEPISGGVLTPGQLVA